VNKKVTEKRKLYKIMNEADVGFLDVSGEAAPQRRGRAEVLTNADST